MKIKVLLLPAVVVLMLLSCVHEHHLQVHELSVDFQSSFDNDHVRLVIEGSEMLDRNLQTNNLLGVCTDGGQVSWALPSGEHTLTVTINGSTTNSTTVMLNRARYVGVGYNRQSNEITFQISDEPFAYD